MGAMSTTPRVVRYHAIPPATAATAKSQTGLRLRTLLTIQKTGPSTTAADQQELRPPPLEKPPSRSGEAAARDRLCRDDGRRLQPPEIGRTLLDPPGHPSPLALAGVVGAWPRPHAEMKMRPRAARPDSLRSPTRHRDSRGGHPLPPVRLDPPSRWAEMTVERVDVHLRMVDDDEPSVAPHPSRETDLTVGNRTDLSPRRAARSPPRHGTSLPTTLGARRNPRLRGILNDIERVLEWQCVVVRIDVGEIEAGRRRTVLRRCTAAAGHHNSERCDHHQAHHGPDAGSLAHHQDFSSAAHRNHGATRRRTRPRTKSHPACSLSAARRPPEGPCSWYRRRYARSGHRVALVADKTPPETSVGVGIALGTVFGAVLFALTSDPVWIAVGLAIGAALGVTYGRIRTSDSDEDNDGDE